MKLFKKAITLTNKFNSIKSNSENNKKYKNKILKLKKRNHFKLMLFR